MIKSRELEKEELRPLYMDFQATTPMVTSLMATVYLLFFYKI